MKYAIVTGGARGLGLGIVRALLEENAAGQVAVIDREPVEAAAEIAGRVHGFIADVTSEGEVTEAVRAITARFGPHPAILCNNAGGAQKPWIRTTEQAEWQSAETWRRFIDLN
jgi:NAD(P)-dependent dehydrogenase (short-subunit alcohol dehydrogenase family)